MQQQQCCQPQEWCKCDWIKIIIILWPILEARIKKSFQMNINLDVFRLPPRLIRLNITWSRNRRQLSHLPHPRATMRWIICKANLYPSLRHVRLCSHYGMHSKRDTFGNSVMAHRSGQWVSRTLEALCATSALPGGCHCTSRIPWRCGSQNASSLYIARNIFNFLPLFRWCQGWGGGNYWQRST